jgi:hypothetical protein
MNRACIQEEEVQCCEVSEHPNILEITWEDQPPHPLEEHLPHIDVGVVDHEDVPLIFVVVAMRHFVNWLPMIDPVAYVEPYFVRAEQENEVGNVFPSTWSCAPIRPLGIDLMHKEPSWYDVEKACHKCFLAGFEEPEVEVCWQPPVFEQTRKQPNNWIRNIYRFDKCHCIVNIAIPRVLQVLQHVGHAEQPY